MSASVYTFLGRDPALRVAVAANAANLLAAAGDDVVVLDLQPRTPPPPLSSATEGLAAALADRRRASAVTAPVDGAPTARPGDEPVVFGTGGVSVLPFSRSLTPVVPPEDDPADAAARVLDDLADAFDAVCAVAPPLPDLVGLDRLWVATLNRTAARSERVVGVLDTGAAERGREALDRAKRGGVRPDCAVAVQPTREAPPPTVVRDPGYPLRGRIPAARDWPEAAADAHRASVARLTDREDVAEFGEAPPTLLDPDALRDDPETDGRRVAADGAGDADRWADVEWTLGDDAARSDDAGADSRSDGTAGGGRDRDDAAERLRRLFR